MNQKDERIVFHLTFLDLFYCFFFAWALQQQGGQKPHVKLEYVEGVLHRKLIFLNAPGDLHVEPHECVIFNDGARSLGCSRSEFRTYVSIPT